MSNHTKDDLYEWNKIWVNQSGRPVFGYKADYSRNKINRFVISGSRIGSIALLATEFYAEIDLR
ncbi:hypothetical protein [Pedobacter sp.]|uniref:hypothetical protein n=1 Tax=Pedobacter sp. TaxID=1411316 RepID=UPI003D7F67D2